MNTEVWSQCQDKCGNTTIWILHSIKHRSYKAEHCKQLPVNDTMQRNVSIDQACKVSADAAMQSQLGCETTPLRF